ncbi:MAG: bifunctional anthranilate synthase component I family protein/class IV aminotransferase, partial [Pseudomonadota bacterium]|nr:bifunctional anthranilate synthase component I family protein/class IV aminotransferase [Pseudomonadota bacterium]
MTATPDCFALLDDCDASADAPRSRLYSGYLRSYHAHDAASLHRLLDTLQREGGHAVALFAYELGAVLQGLSGMPPAGAEGAMEQPLAQVLVFARCEHLSAEAVALWLAARDDGAAAGVINLTPELDQAAFTSMVEQIRAYIAAGDTYQVNATFRLRFDAYGTPVALYRRLRQRQPVPYGALIALPDGSSVLSLSPELFVAHGARALTARPMKGTARALGDAEADAHTAAQLAADPKNRAENLMIVDLLRNDLGRVAVTGSVAVPALFQVTRYGDVLQMTSTVTAQLRDELSLAQVVTALFPCGSITGAPKRRTMQIIAELEASRRGLYTGAIGWFDQPTLPNTASAVGDFCMSVPIRTLLLQAPGAGGLRRGEMGIGAGIVHDSVAAEEWAECALKAQFLRAMPPQFTLFETMAVTRGGCVLLSRHLDRLQRSARTFGFVCDRAAMQHHVDTVCAGLDDERRYRLRLTLHPDGSCSSATAALTALEQPVRLLLA